MMLDTFLSQAKTQFDLTEASDQQSLYALTEALLGTDDISLEEIKTCTRQADTPLEFKIAAKLAESHQALAAIKQPMKIGIVFAMWGEHHRLYPKSDDNPHGEDALRVKLEQLAWLSRYNPHLSWTIYAVDDGCPHHSGDIAKKIAAEHPLGQAVKVLFLKDGINDENNILGRLNSVDESRKGGSVILGAQQALADGMDALMYTDADNSVHLGQIGLLLAPWQQNQQAVVLGNRKHPDAVLVKQEARWGIGIKLLRHMQRMIGKTIFEQGIHDTQAAFKLYDCKILAEIIQDPTVFDFSFDTDWILAILAKKQQFAQVPFAFIDSAAESASITQGPMSTWETLLKGLVAAVRKHGVEHHMEMANVLDDEIHNAADLDALINHLPAQLANAEDKDLGNPDLMSAAEVQTWIQACKCK